MDFMLYVLYVPLGITLITTVYRFFETLLRTPRIRRSILCVVLAVPFAMSVVWGAEHLGAYFEAIALTNEIVLIAAILLSLIGQLGLLFVGKDRALEASHRLMQIFGTAFFIFGVISIINTCVSINNLLHGDVYVGFLENPLWLDTLLVECAICGGLGLILRMSGQGKHTNRTQRRRNRYLMKVPAKGQDKRQTPVPPIIHLK